jgi:hypothetical protein
MSVVIAWPMHKAAAQDAFSAGLAPTALAASMMRRIVEAKPTTTAVKAAEVKLNQPLAEVPPVALATSLM